MNFKRGTTEIFREIGRFFTGLWQIVWKDDSPKGWIFSILFLFIIIKFLFFPVLNLATGTTLPLAIVESCSMYHEGNLFANSDSWWQDHEENYEESQITKTGFDDSGFKKGFNKGDILFIRGVKPQDIELGDVIIFSITKSNTPIIHRVVDIKTQGEEYIFSTMGDNVGFIQSFETTIRGEQLVGRASTRLIPYVGWGKLIAVDLWDKIFLGGDFNYLRDGYCTPN